MTPPNGSSAAAANISGGGLATGTITSDTLAVKWHFSLEEAEFETGPEAVGSVSWKIIYDLFLGDEPTFLGKTLECTGSGFGEHIGTGEFTGLAGLSPESWSITLEN